jgi:hypothetical protein
MGAVLQPSLNVSEDGNNKYMTNNLDVVHYHEHVSNITFWKLGLFLPLCLRGRRFLLRWASWKQLVQSTERD